MVWKGYGHVHLRTRRCNSLFDASFILKSSQGAICAYGLNRDRLKPKIFERVWSSNVIRSAAILRSISLPAAIA